MTAPELPQPIYPTGSPTPGPSTPPPGYGPPLTPPPHHGGSGGSGGGGLGGKKNLLIGAGVAVVVVILAAVAFAIASGDDDGDDTASGDRLSVDGGADDGGDRGDDGGDVSGRAQLVAAQQIIGAESSTVSCIAGALEQDQQMLAALEDQPNGVVLTDSADADSYASLIMGCASPGEMLDQMVAALPTFGYGTYEIGCFEQQASVLTSADWEEFIRIVVQPDRMSELEPLLGELTFC